MNTNQGALYFGAGIDLQQWRNNVNEMRRDILGLTNTTQQQTKTMDTSFRNIGLGLTTYFSGAALGGFINQIINVRGEFQKTEIAFGTMLKSTDKAKELMGQMVELAAKTPFSLQDVSSGAKQLLAFQVPANEVVDTLTRLGNIAAGLSVPLDRINLVYGQVKAKGKLMGDDLRQFTEAGIPMVAELAKKFGTTTSAITEMVSAGKIGFKDVQDVLFSMTNEGGMFFNLMEKQSASLSGKISNLKDNIAQMFNKIGESNEGILNSGIDGLSYLVEHYEDVGKSLLTLIEIYGAYRVVLALTDVAQGKVAAPAIIQGFTNLIKLIRGATVAQTALNAASIANPYVLLATAFATVVAVAYNYRKELGQLIGVIDEATDKTRYQESVDKQLTESFSKGVIEKKTKIQQLIAAIQSENSKFDDRKRAYEQLIKLDQSFVGTLDNQYKATYRLGDAFDHVVKKMQAFALAQAEIAVKTKYLEEKASADFNLSLAKVKYNEANKVAKQQAELLRQGKITVKEYAKAVKPYEDVAKNLQDAQKAANLAGKDIDYANKAEKEKLNLLNQQRIIIEAQIKGGKIQGKTISESQKKKLKEQLDIVKMQQSAYAKQIDDAVTEPESPTKTEETAAKTKKAVDKIYGEDTIKGLQQRVDKYREIMEKSSIGSDAFNNAKSSMEAYQKKLDELTKEQQKKSFDEELAETERQWNVRYQIAKQYGEDIAKSQFPDLKGDSYFDDISAKYKTLDDKLKSGVGVSDEDIKQWQKLKEILDSLNGVKDPLTNFTDGLDEELSKLSTYAEKMEFLNKQLYSPEIMSGEGIDNKHKAEIIKRQEDLKKSWKQTYQSILEEQKTYEEKSAELAKQYAAAKESDQYKNGTDEERKKIDDWFSKKATDIFIDTLQSSEEWAKAFTDVNMVATQKLEELKTILQTKLSEAKTIEEKIKIGEFIKKIDDTLAQRNPFANLSNAIGKYTESLKNAKSAQDKYNDAGAEFGQDSDEAKSALERLKTAQDGVNTSKLEMANSLSNFASKGISYISDIKGIITDVQGAFDDLGLSLDNGFGDVLDKMSGVMDGMQQQLEGVMQIAQGILTGNPIAVVGGVIKSIAGQIKTYAALFNNDRKRERNIKKWAAAVNELKNKYTELAYAVEKALGTAKYDNQNSMIKNLKEQQATLQKMYNEESKKKKKDQGKLDDYKNQIADINRQIQDITDDMVSNILQTDVKSLADSLGDALLAAWQKGASGADAYKEVAKKAMQDAVLNALKMAFLEPQLKAFTNQLMSAMGYSQNADGTVTGSFDGLTSQEQQNLQDMMGQIYSQFEQAMSGYTDLFGVGETANDSLEGAVKGVTEETASVIAGQMNAIRINQGELLKIQQINQEIFKSQLLALTQIEANTRNLVQIRRDISEMNSKMAKGLAGIG